MADICDHADGVIENNIKQGLAQIQRYTGISAIECECGEEIPEGRRLAIPGVQLCAPCQTLADLAKKGVRRA